MSAMVLEGHGGLDQLAWHQDWPTPQPADGEVLIRVHACGLNNTDVNTRTAWYSKGATEATTGEVLDGVRDDDGTWGGKPIQFPRIQGADVVGTVVVGPDELIDKRVMIDTWLRDWKQPMNRDRMGYYGSECDGGFAEYTTIDARQVHVVESELGDAELATFATAFVTAENMLNRAEVSADDTVVVTGASGGVGSALIQVAKRRGARVVALAAETKHAVLKDVGADLVLPRMPADLASSLANERVTVIADVVGGSQWPVLVDVLQRGGRYTVAGAIAGPIVEMDLRTLYLRDLTFAGATTVPPGVFAEIVGYIENEAIKPVLAATYPLRKLHEAQRDFLSKQRVGSIVVTP
ncbi:MAG: alcohol dehydrogenase family protein [Woeseiaceae bacterium]